MVEKPYESLTGLTIKLLTALAKTAHDLEPNLPLETLIYLLDDLKWVEVRATCPVSIHRFAGVCFDNVGTAGIMARYPVLETKDGYYRIGKDAWITSNPRYVRICKMGG